MQTLAEIKHEIGRYNVRRVAGAETYVVESITGRVYGEPSTLREAVERADLYRGDDEREADEERACARFDR